MHNLLFLCSSGRSWLSFQFSGLKHRVEKSVECCDKFYGEGHLHDVEYNMKMKKNWMMVKIQMMMTRNERSEGSCGEMRKQDNDM